jgi:hypothetical protein
MVDSHWICYNTGKPFEANLEKFGFVYIITNTKSGKAYVGCKQYYIGRTKKQHKWETYMSSSKYLKADIEKIGKKHFIFEVIAEYKNKRSLNYYEAYYQMKWNVLTATLIADSDEQAFYNSYVGGKWYRPIESYQDPEFRRKISEARTGKPFTEDHKRKISESRIGDKNPMYGKNFSKEHRKKISETKIGDKNPMYGKNFSKEHRKKLSEKKIGDKNPMFGKKHTEETKKKMSEVKTGEKHPMFGEKHTEEAKKKMSEERLAYIKRKEVKDVNQESNV